MPLFGTSKRKWVEIDHKEFFKRVKKMTGYRDLARMVGDTYATNAVEAMWGINSSGGKAGYFSDSEDGFKKTLAGLMAIELDRVIQGSNFINALKVRATSGNLRRVHGDDTMVPSDYGAKDSDDDLEKATRYIIHSSTTLIKTADSQGAPITAAAIKAALQSASLFDVRSETVLRDLHRRCVNQVGLKPTRGMNKTAPYPSTGGAGYLLAMTFDLAKALPTPAAGQAEWMDICCFLFGAVVRSHGFTDGNGRVGRAAYAAAMLKGGLPFAPLKPGVEKLLHGLSHVS